MPRNDSKPTHSSGRPRLGRGLDALLPSSAGAGATQPPPSSSVTKLPIEALEPNRSQPRRDFDKERLQELMQSIQELGILEPIVVRKGATHDGYDIVAGERRWRAAQLAGLHEVPVHVRDLSDKEAFEAALVENLQREDLNPVETARAFARLIDDHGHSQESVASRVGKDRSTVANALRLLKLPEEVQAMLEEGALAEGHARALLTAPDVRTMKALAHQAVRATWSVREVERRARVLSRGPSEKTGAATSSKSPNVRDLEARLSHALGATVTVRDQKGRGHLQITYQSYDELDRILGKLLG